jgi:hypothetical protein
MTLADLSRALVNLDPRGALLLGGSIAVVCFTIYTATSWYRLSHVPGPFLASVTGIWAYRSVKSLQFHKIALAVQRRYGKVARITPNAVMISDAETLWRINSARSAYTRGDWYACARLNAYGDNVISELDTVKHDQRKAKLISGFSGKGLMDLESNLDTQLAILVDTLRAKANSSDPTQTIVDIGRTLQYFQVDLITLAGLGKAWGDLPNYKDHFQYLATGDFLIPFINGITMIPFLRHIVFSSLYLRWFGPSTTDGWLG